VNPRPPLSQLSPWSMATPLLPKLGEQQERESGMGDGLDRALGFMDGADGAGWINLLVMAVIPRQCYVRRRFSPFWGSLVGVMRASSWIS
jgi:hypothetical protein